MPIKYSNKCKYCKKQYTGFGKYFCTQGCRANYFWKTGILKGHISWNKGTKGVVKPNKGSFKKGEMSQWKNGKTITSQGYISVWVSPKTRKLEHVIVAEKIIGRSLNNNECVHHINHIRTDNRPENIMIITKRDHGIYHCTKYWNEKKNHILPTS